MKVNDFFASTIDESLIDSTVSAFNNMSYDITDKQKTKWRKNMNKNNHNKETTDSRFIPIRDENKFDQQQTYQTENKKEPDRDIEMAAEEETKEEIKEIKEEQQEKILSFKNKAPLAEDGYISNLRTIYTATDKSRYKKAKKNVRYICQTATRVLDAPDLMDDFYLNLVDWGCNNMIGIGLCQSIYLWNSSNGEIKLLKEYENNDTYICSIKWNHNAQYIAVGTSDNIITLYDSKTFKPLRKLCDGHEARVSSLSWNHEKI